ncbi:recombinase family protein [Pseudomonas tohonis]|nr:integrase [Pseudomonas alcaligenes OT 69]MDN4144970.1 recombinase family protein [Pseudomonas tohonis]
MSAPKVFSYLRFSDPRQSSGSSADRQQKYAADWAAKHGMVLDESLSLKDEGLSAYHEAHVKQGALGAFLKAIDQGRIPVGSVLVVEGLDRLSRAEPLLAQAQLAQIINGGITVVTASDGREYNRAGLKAEPMNLVYSLLVMIRAHEESDTKSKRVKASIRRLCEGWVAGTYRGLIRNGKDPHWLSWNGSAWELIPERVEGIRAVLELYQQGIGATRSIRLLKERGWSFNHEYIYRLVQQPALRGAKRIEVEGEDYLLEGYYPSLLSGEEWEDLQLQVQRRVKRRGKGEICGIVTGIGITTCGYCGTALVAQNLMSRARKDGTIAEGHRRLHCCSYSSSGGCKAGSCSVVPVERAVLSYCSDQLNLDRLLEPTEDNARLQRALKDAQLAVEDVKKRLDRVTEALLADTDGPAPLAFVRKARELEAELVTRRAAERQAEVDLAARASEKSPAHAEVWAELTGRIAQGDEEARNHARQLVQDTFESLVIYMRGMVPDPKGKYIDMAMKSRAGQVHWLRIERRTGAWTRSATRFH